MIKAHHLSFALILSLGAISAQSSGIGDAGSDGAKAADLVLAAEAHLDAARPDDALLTLWRAEHQLLHTEGSAAAGEDLRAIVRDMLRESDPLDEDRRRLATSSAQELVGLARAYGRRKWYAVALALLDEADALAPGSSEMLRSELAGKTGPRPGAAVDAATPAPVAAAPDEPPADLLQRLKVIERTGAWRRDAAGIHSPPLQDGSVLMLAKEPTHGDDDLEIEMRLGTHGKAALAFGVTSPNSFYLAEVNLIEGSRSALSIYRLADRTDMTRLGETFFDLPAGATKDWLRLKIEVRGRNVLASVNELGQTAAECPDPPRGSVGLFVSDNSTNKKSVLFRNLHISAPATPTDPTSASPADRIRRRLASAETALAGKRTEEGVAVLNALRGTALQGLAAGDRATLAGRIDSLLAQHDPLHAKQGETRHAIATGYLELGQRYLEGERPRAALALLEYAEHHDHAAAVAAVDALAERLGPAAMTPDAPDAAPAAKGPTDNQTLRDWFLGGRQFRNAGWEWTDDYLASPTLENASALHTSKQKISGSGHASVQLRMSGGACAGFVFALRSKHDFYLLALEQNQLGSALSISRYYSNQWEKIGRQDLAELPREAWIPVSVSYGDEELEFRAGAGEPLRLKRELFQLRGATQCGLYAWADAIGGAAQFRNLEMQIGK